MMKIKKGLKTSRKAHSCHVVWNSSSEVTTRRMEESCMRKKPVIKHHSPDNCEDNQVPQLVN